MKNLLTFLMILMSSSSYAQFVIEDNDVTENAKEFAVNQVAISPAKYIEIFQLSCSDSEYPQLGESFRKNILESVEQVANSNEFSLNGTFSLIFNFDEEGKLKNFDLQPQVTNSKFLENQLRSAFFKQNLIVKPAKCGGRPAASKMRFKINFSTEMLEI